MGAEEVQNNTIKDCNGDGMILDGLRGPIHDNVIKDNAGAGIHVTRVPIDLGGGVDTCPGNNVLMGNGNYDLFIECQSTQYPTLYARNNVWDHTSPADIIQYDIRDASDSTGLVNVDFTPWGYLEVEEAWRQGGMGREAGRVGDLSESCGGTNSDNCNMDNVTFNRDLTWVIYDIFGREVNAKIVSGGGEDWTINISSLSPGMYIVFGKDTENRLSSGKFIKSLK